MALKAGTIKDYKGSMAEAMEHAFLKEWPEAMGTASPPASNNQMRMLFVAIAQGVVRHLKDQAEGAFNIYSVDVKQTDSRIESSGTARYGATYLPVTVTQKARSTSSSEPAKPVKGKGTGKLKIVTTGTLHKKTS